MSLCDTSCLPCVYSSAASGWICCCDYFLITRERRGCKAGKGCGRRALGTKRASPDARAYLLPPGAGRIETEADRVAAAKQTKAQPEKAPEKAPEARPPREYTRDPALDGLTLRERDRIYAQRARERMRNRLAGRQHAAIRAYAKAHGLRYADMAQLIGVKPKTFAKWAAEHTSANWEKLALLGIEKPEGL